MRKKSEIVAAIATQSGHSKAAVEEILNAQRDVVHQALQDSGEFQLHDVAIMNVTERPARTGRNPQSGEEMQIAASKGIRFKLAKTLKRAIND